MIKDNLRFLSRCYNNNFVKYLIDFLYFYSFTRFSCINMVKVWNTCKTSICITCSTVRFNIRTRCTSYGCISIELLRTSLLLITNVYYNYWINNLILYYLLLHQHNNFCQCLLINRFACKKYIRHKENCHILNNLWLHKGSILYFLHILQLNIPNFYRKNINYLMILK